MRRAALALTLLAGACGARTGLELTPSPDLGMDAGVARDLGIDGGRDLGSDIPSTPPPLPNGCADGLRDAFRDATRYPNIAGCAGGWDVAGIAHPIALGCGRGAGDDGANPTGVGCNVADLCSVSFHLCLGPMEVARSSPDGCAGSHDAAGAFFSTRGSGPGCGVCATGTNPSCTGMDCQRGCLQTARTTNDLFGCGTLGDAPDSSTCTPLDRFSNNVCSALPSPWFCTDDGSGTHEADTVTKRGPAAGGVLCCRD